MDARAMFELPMVSRVDDPLIDVNGVFISLFDAICSGRLKYQSDDGNLQTITHARHTSEKENLYIDCVDRNAGGYEYTRHDALRRFGGKSEVKDIGRENWLVSKLPMLTDDKFKEVLNAALVLYGYQPAPPHIPIEKLQDAIFNEADIRGNEIVWPSFDSTFLESGEG